MSKYLGSFKITDADMEDGVEETDGIYAVSTPLGKIGSVNYLAKPKQ